MRSATTRLTIVLGTTQMLAWATTFYLPAVIAGAAAHSLGASRAEIVGGFSWALLITGICAPRVGRRIDRAGGRGVLAAGSVVMAAGLALLAAAQGLPLWYAGWTVLGAGMALGLYDATFATIGHLLGRGAAPAITGVTLIAGFASSIGWPAGAALAGAIGWRDMLLLYAGMQVAINLPLVLLLVPAGPAPEGPQGQAEAPGPAASGGGPTRVQALACLSGFFTLRWFITSAVAVFILPLLRGTGLSGPEAVAVAALIGPGQVAGRVLEWTVARRLGLLTRARLGAALLPLGVLALLPGGLAAASAFALLYGMSNGILTINRGTLPLALFGPSGYAALLGWLAVPVLLAQASAPILAAPVVSALPALTVFGLAGAAAALGLLLLAPLRVAE